MISSYLLKIFLLFFTSFHGIKSTSTGIWIDDGFGHTIKAELPPWDAKLLKRNMLDLFGLPEPNYRPRHHYKAHGSGPNYMMRLYDEIDERGHAPNLEPAQRATVDAADAIMTFANKVPPHNPSKHLQFNVDDVPMEMILLGAELRVHKSTPAKAYNETLFLRVIMIRQDMSEQVVAKSIIRGNGWISLNVTDSFLSWVINPPSNKGLRLSLRKAKQKHELHLTDGEITGSHGEIDYRPFLVGYFSKGSGDARYEVNKIRKVREARPPVSDQYKYGAPFSVKPMSSMNQRVKEQRQCQKMGLHVSFKDLGWEHWVIAPEGYDANYCDGRCDFPMLAGQNATNHAIIQTLVVLMQAARDGELPPEPSCAPRDLTTISVLYHDYSNNVVLKKFPKMIVKTCGCI